MPEQLVLSVFDTQKSEESRFLQQVCRDELAARVEVCSELGHSVLRESQLAVLFLPEDVGQALSLIDYARSHFKTRPVIAVCHPNSDGSHDVLCEAQIDDLLTVPLRAREVSQRIRDLVAMWQLSDAESLNGDLLTMAGMGQFVGRSPKFLDEVGKIPRMSRSDESVLIMGETGVGKELCARAIHYLGMRAAEPFTPVNCGGIPDHLFENEFFGHARGAFTDAHGAQKGLVDEAHRGTLLLDEVDALSHPAQIKLLRFLEDKRFKPLGASSYSQANVRVIAASNVDLAEEVRRGTFRQDLFYRLNVLSIRLPPLRERKEDIPILANHFLHKSARGQGRTQMRFSNKAMEKLVRCRWPGNIRQLKNIIENLVTFSVSKILRADAIPIEDEDRCEVTLHTESFQHAKKKAITEFEKAYLLRVLNESNWNISQAARQAGLDRRSLQRLINKHSLSWEETTRRR